MLPFTLEKVELCIESALQRLFIELLNLQVKGAEYGLDVFWLLLNSLDLKEGGGGMLVTSFKGLQWNSNMC